MTVESAPAAGSLQEYVAKRDFTKTAEPAAVVPRTRTGPLVFAVQKHSATRLHYDLRLELDGVLKSWAVPNGPSCDPNDRRLAVQTEDHPMEYATWEGVIPKGEYGAGEMIVWDRGTYAPEAKENGATSREAHEEAIRAGLARGRLTVQMNGQKLRGLYTLVRTSKNPRDWLLIKKADQLAAVGRDLLADDASVLSGLTIEQLRAGKRPSADAIKVGASGDEIPGARRAGFLGAVEPMLPSIAERPFSDPSWLFEPKLDGYRVIATVKNSTVRLWSRRGLDATKDYPCVVQALEKLDGELVLDGEVVALDEQGIPSFDLLKQRLGQIKQSKLGTPASQFPLVYYVFDLLYRDGLDLRTVPLERRKVLLRDALFPSEVVRPVDTIEGEGLIAFQAAANLGLEGLIAKHRRSIYEAGRRSQQWLKLKTVQTDEFVIGGFTAGKGHRADTIGSLMLGQYDADGKLRYVGHAGSGFDDKGVAAMRRRLDGIATDSCPFEGEYLANARPTWVRPELVAEVKFVEWTSDHKLRAPVFLRLREDKAPSEVTRAEVVAPPTSPLPLGEGQGEGMALPALVQEVLDQLARPVKEMTLEVGRRRIKLTNLDKPLWPDFTKRDLLTYLARVSPWYLPHLRDRPLTLIRMPDGIDGPRFYQKHPDASLPDWVETVVVYSDHNVGDETLIVCQELATLLWLGQMGALELHSWYSRTHAEPDGGSGTRDFAGNLDNMRGSLLNHPDYVVFDLDPVRPDEKSAPAFDPVRFANVRKAALWLKEALDSLSLPSKVKTSGRSGLHVYVPIVRNLDYDVVRALSQTIAQYLKQHHPREIALEWAVAKRVGEVFVDTNQNVRGKTLASIYSPRATPWGGVSMPLHWDEVPTADPRAFTLATAPARLAEVGDVWGDFLEAKVDLKRQLGMG